MKSQDGFNKHDLQSRREGLSSLEELLQKHLSQPQTQPPTQNNLVDLMQRESERLETKQKGLKFTKKQNPTRMGADMIAMK